jgi:hypothetical protein
MCVCLSDNEELDAGEFDDPADVSSDSDHGLVDSPPVEAPHAGSSTAADKRGNV